MAPHLVSVLVLCLLLYSSLNLVFQEHSRDWQATEKSEGKMDYKKLYLSAVITFHIFNPCGNVTMLYLLSYSDN